ncbi:MAG: helix-turn-helix transcriptional regulator [Salinivirgaceae bacterium]
MIFKILKIFFQTIDLYIKELVSKNIALEQLKAAEKKEAEQKLKNQTLKNNIEKHQRELEYKHKELASSFSKIMQFNALLDKIKKDILDGNYKDAIVNVTVKQSENYNLDSFILKFNEVYPNFLLKLTETFPQLTKTEVRVCILISSGLKSHEIAELLNVSEASIGKYRNRIRKKLNLENNSDIVQYLFGKFNYNQISNLENLSE